jgi:hypothetical protein
VSKLRPRHGTASTHLTAKTPPATPEITTLGTVRSGRASNTGVDDEERQALRAEGLDRDDPVRSLIVPHLLKGDAPDPVAEEGPVNGKSTKRSDDEDREQRPYRCSH